MRSQSNMEFAMPAVANKTVWRQRANAYPQLRFFSVGHATQSATPLRDLKTVRSLIDGKPVGLALWALFGTTNQLLASLTLLVATMYLYQRGRNYWVTLVPMVVMYHQTLSPPNKNLC